MALLPLNPSPTLSSTMGYRSTSHLNNLGIPWRTFKLLLSSWFFSILVLILQGVVLIICCLLRVDGPKRNFDTNELHPNALNSSIQLTSCEERYMIVDYETENELVSIQNHKLDGLQLQLGPLLMTVATDNNPPCNVAVVELLSAVYLLCLSVNGLWVVLSSSWPPILYPVLPQFEAG